MAGSRFARRRGFTLIEVLVALAIVSIALMAAMRAASQDTTDVSAVRSHLLASWVAQNLLAEHRARGDWLAPGIVRGTGQEAGVVFPWREEITATPNPAFRRLDVFVYSGPGETHELVHYTAFIVHPVGTAG